MQQHKSNKLLWVKFTKTLLATVMYESGKLKQPLGPWVKAYKKWKADFDEKNKMVYIYDNNWYKHPIMRYTRNILEFSREGTLTNAPRHLSPVTDVMTVVYGPYLRCTRPAVLKWSNQLTNKFVTFREYIASLPA
eukprot:4195669-Ditylum_brightwellii.AAC.1